MPTDPTDRATPAAARAPGRRVRTTRRGAVVLVVVGALVASGWAAVHHRFLRHSGSLQDLDHLLLDERTRELAAGDVRVTALGTTTMLLDDGETQVLVDPFLTPTSLFDAVSGRRVSSDERAVESALRRLGADRVAAVLVSHSHHDHVFDVASVARRTGADVYGSTSSLNVARGGGVPGRQLHEIDAGRAVQVGGFTIRALASRHSPGVTGGEDATIDAPLPQPVRIRSFRQGGTFDFLVEHGDRTMLFKNSAHWVPGALDDVRADVLFLAVARLGKEPETFVEGYLDATVGTVDPAVVVATHWNDFFSPVAPDLPLQRVVVDDTPLAFERLERYAADVDVPVRLLDAYASIVVR